MALAPRWGFEVASRRGSYDRGMSSAAVTTARVPLARDVRPIALVGLAHATSHFFHMLLPPLFPLFVRDFDVSYAQLGLLVTVFFAVSGIGQATAGFVVDRFGARPALYAALACFVLAALATSVAQGLGGLVLAAALAGLGNAPFHPVDFTILNRRVSVPRLGHAYSVHGISGNLGWALAPLVLLGVTAATGSWRLAVLVAAGWAAIVLLVMFLYRDDLNDQAVSGTGSAASDSASGAANKTAAADEHPLAFLKLPSIWLCFSFFFWTTAALSAIQGFASPALQQLYGLPMTLTATVVTGYMLCGAVGMVLGGFLVARTQRLELVIGACLAFAAACLALVAIQVLSPIEALVVASLAGVGTGLAGPSRDTMIRRAAPPGATGRVYGMVYSGLDVGFAAAAPLFGALVDRGQSRWVFLGAACLLLAGIVSAAWVSLGSRRAMQRQMPSG